MYVCVCVCVSADLVTFTKRTFPCVKWSFLTSTYHFTTVPAATFPESVTLQREKCISEIDFSRKQRFTKRKVHLRTYYLPTPPPPSPNVVFPSWSDVFWHRPIILRKCQQRLFQNMSLYEEKSTSQNFSRKCHFTKRKVPLRNRLFQKTTFY